MKTHLMLLASLSLGISVAFADQNSAPRLPKEASAADTMESGAEAVGEAVKAINTSLLPKEAQVAAEAAGEEQSFQRSLSASIADKSSDAISRATTAGTRESLEQSSADRPSGSFSTISAAVHSAPSTVESRIAAEADGQRLIANATAGKTLSNYNKWMPAQVPVVALPITISAPVSVEAPHDGYVQSSSATSLLTGH